MSKSRKHHIIILLVLTFGTYYNSLSNGFTYDDNLIVAYNSFIKDWSNFSGIFSNTYFSQSGEATYRPMATLTYFVDFFLWQLRPFGYHLTNLILHLTNVILLYFLVVSLAEDSRAAFLAALLFAVHPVQAEAVNAISYREDLLAAFFLFLSFIVFIQSVSCNSFHASEAVLKRKYLLSLLFFLFALLSKEMASSFPLLIIGYIFCMKKSGKDIQEIISSPSYFIGCLVTLIIYFILYFWIFQNPDPPQYFSPQIYHRLLVLPYVVLMHLKIILVPWNLNADYNVIFTWFPVLFSIFIIVILVYAIFLLTRNHWVERFGVWWFFVMLLPVLNIFPINHVVAERYLYLPMGGICIFFSLFLLRIYKEGEGNRAILLEKKYFFALTIVLFFFLMMRTVSRNTDWKNDFTLWSETVISSPESFVARYGLGLQYINMGEKAKAVRELNKALQINPDFAETRYDLGLLYVNMRFYRKGVRELEKALGLNFDNSRLHFNLGVAYAGLNHWERAIREYQLAIKLKYDHLYAYNNLGDVYYRQGRVEEAVKEWKAALKIDPGFQIVKKKLKKL